MSGVVNISEPGAAEPDAFSYEICGQDRVVSVENGDCGHTEPAMLNRRLWDLISDGNVADIYRALVQRVRAERRTIHFRFRCDEPDMRRDLEMTMEPLDCDGIRFSSRRLGAEPQSPKEFFRRHSQAPRDVDLCRCCGAVRVAEQWSPVDMGLKALGLFAEDIQFRTRPTVCPQCRGQGH